MRKTNSEGRNGRELKERELRDDELGLVSGGMLGLVNSGTLKMQRKKSVIQNLRA